jgi:hypothetical protein
MIKFLLQSKLCFIVPLLSFLYTPQEKPLKEPYNNNDYKQSSLITKIANLKASIIVSYLPSAAKNRTCVPPLIRSVKNRLEIP